MAYIEDLTFTNAASISDNDIVYVGKPGDIDPDRRTSVVELITRVGSGLRISSGALTMTLSADTTAPSVAYSARSGRWSRVGDLVHVEFTLTTSTRTGGSGGIRITGLPFAPRDTVMLSGRSSNVTYDAGRVPYFYVTPLSGQAVCRIGSMISAGSPVTRAIGDWPSNGSVIVAGTYTTSDP